jgi:hypothetical protein
MTSVWNNYIEEPRDFAQFLATLRTLGLDRLLINQAPLRQSLASLMEKSG